MIDLTESIKDLDKYWMLYIYLPVLLVHDRPFEIILNKILPQKHKKTFLNVLIGFNEDYFYFLKVTHTFYADTM